MEKRLDLPTISIAGFLLVTSLVLAFFFITAAADAGLEARGGIGPATWPKVMLIGIAVSAAMIVARELARLFAAQSHERGGAAKDAPAYDNWKAAIGIALLVAYGLAVPFIGFALATALFLVVWLAVGGLKKPLTIALVSVVGTITLLYVFAGLSKMPLDRGIGLFDAATVTLYRALGIY